jgi:hypothetical protein
MTPSLEITILNDKRNRFLKIRSLGILWNYEEACMILKKHDFSNVVKSQGHKSKLAKMIFKEVDHDAKSEY